MKKQRAISILFAGLVVTLTLGCAPTRTQKSAGEQIDDTIVLTKVKTSLIADPLTKGRNIDVEVFRGVVQLNGFVDSIAEKTQATTVARAIVGVTEVRNNLMLDTHTDSLGSAVDDVTITGKVKAALVGSAATKAHQINVATEQGVVQLSGFVDDAAAKDAAARLARNVGGVRSVVNLIDVRKNI